MLSSFPAAELAVADDPASYSLLKRYFWFSLAYVSAAGLAAMLIVHLAYSGLDVRLEAAVYHLGVQICYLLLSAAYFWRGAQPSTGVSEPR